MLVVNIYDPWYFDSKKFNKLIEALCWSVGYWSMQVVKAIDAVSREQLVQIAAVMGIGTAAPVFSMAPLRPAVLLPTITEEDRVILNNVEKVAKFLTSETSKASSHQVSTYIKNLKPPAFILNLSNLLVYLNVWLHEWYKKTYSYIVLLHSLLFSVEQIPDILLCLAKLGNYLLHDYIHHVVMWWYCWQFSDIVCMQFYCMLLQ